MSETTTLFTTLSNLNRYLWNWNVQIDSCRWSTNLPTSLAVHFKGWQNIEKRADWRGIRPHTPNRTVFQRWRLKAWLQDFFFQNTWRKEKNISKLTDGFKKINQHDIFWYNNPPQLTVSFFAPRWVWDPSHRPWDYVEACWWPVGLNDPKMVGMETHFCFFGLFVDYFLTFLKTIWMIFGFDLAKQKWFWAEFRHQTSRAFGLWFHGFEQDWKPFFRTAFPIKKKKKHMFKNHRPARWRDGANFSLSTKGRPAVRHLSTCPPLPCSCITAMLEHWNFLTRPWWVMFCLFLDSLLPSMTCCTDHQLTILSILAWCCTISASI